MKERVRFLRREMEHLAPPVQPPAAVGLIRILLQHAVLALAEWVVERIHSDHHGVLEHNVDFAELRAPTDGTLVEVLLNTIVIAENLGWTGIFQLIWTPVSSDRPAHKFSTTQHATLETVLRGYIAWRNNSIYGHGLDNGDPVALVDVIDLVLDRLGAILPDIRNDKLHLEAPTGELELKVLRPNGGHLVCYRHIRMIANGRCVVRGQRQLSLSEGQDVSWEAEDVLAFRARSVKSYSLWETGDQKWCPIVLVPSRLTHHFSGRKDELSRLKLWADDADSRACMLYGDGGMGKTTLAIEFVHRLLDGSIASVWKPEMVTFYTAKQTRWGLDGLEKIRTTGATVSDLAAEIYRRLANRPADRSWFDKSVEATIDRLATFLAEWRINRDNHLLILDNTETMATDERQVQLLGEQVWQLAKRVGRVLITSRRAERLQAQPIDVPPLAPNESVTLLRNWAKDLSCQSILQAGGPTLQNLATQLGNRPLTLEVFIRTLRDGDSLDDAFTRILHMEQTDFGTFLYEDAWGRFSQRIRALLLLMAAVADHHDEALVTLCCAQQDVIAEEAYAALRESRGIATVRRADGHTEVILNNDFIQFAKGKGMPEQNVIDRLRARYLDVLRNKTADARDRISVAYRTPHARAAAQAIREDRFDDAEREYKSAIEIDWENGALYERYADALLSRQRYDDAFVGAEAATELAPEDAECWFTRGIIESRLGRLDAAEVSFAYAVKFGKPFWLCKLHLAYGFANAQPPRVADGFAALVEARKVPQPERGGAKQHLAEVGRLEVRFANLARRGVA